MRCRLCNADFCWSCGQTNHGKGGTWHPNGPCIPHLWEERIRTWRLFNPNVPPLDDPLPMAFNFIDLTRAAAQQLTQIRQAIAGTAEAPPMFRRSPMYREWAQKRISDAAIVAVAEAAHESARALAGAYVALTVLSERTGEPAKRSRRAARRLLASPATRGFREHVDRLRTASIELQMLFERRLERRLDNLLSYRKVGAVMHAMRLLNRAEPKWRRASVELM